MGIHGLTQILKKKCKEGTYGEKANKVHLKRLSGHRIAIDLLNIFHRRVVAGYDYLTSIDPSTIPSHYDAITRALVEFSRILEILVSQNITPIVVCDGVATKMKSETQKTRRKQTDRYAEKQVDAEIRLDELKEFSSKLQYETDDIEEIKERADQALRDQGEILNLNQCIVTSIKGSVRIGNEDKKRVEELMNALGIPFIIAPSEAEKYCAQLVREGYCIGAYSNDTDLLVHGCPLIITNINIGNYSASIVFLDNILRQLELTMDQFVDFCIMCGTDYNPNVPSFGPIRCYEFITEYGSLEDMPDEIDKTSKSDKKKGKTKIFRKNLLRNIQEDKDWREIKREFVEGRAEIDPMLLYIEVCDIELARRLVDEQNNFDRYIVGHDELMNSNTIKVPFVEYIVM